MLHSLNELALAEEMRRLRNGNGPVGWFPMVGMDEDGCRKEVLKLPNLVPFCEWAAEKDFSFVPTAVAFCFGAAGYCPMEGEEVQAPGIRKNTFLPWMLAANSVLTHSTLFSHRVVGLVSDRDRGRRHLMCIQPTAKTTMLLFASHVLRSHYVVAPVRLPWH